MSLSTASRITRVKGPLPGERGRAILEQWHRYEADVTGYQAPVVWDRAQGCVVHDVDGNVYLDWTSGVLVTNVGHCHPRLVEAMQRAGARLLNNYECPTASRAQAAQCLVEALPPHLNQCFFLSTGSEAIEAIARLMKRKTGKFEIISFQGGFHGRTTSAAALGGLAGPKKLYGPTIPGVIRVPYPNPYRDANGWCDEGPEFERYFAFLDEMVQSNSVGSLAGVIVEPYQGAGGFIFPPAGWLARLERWIRERDLLFALDEVQSSYGRTGTMWAMEHEGVRPDLVAIGKGIGSGIPVSAVASTSEIFSCLKKGEMSSTMGGNPVSCEAVIAVLDIMRDERLAENAQRMGNIIFPRLRELGESHPLVGDVRGMGLVGGIEFVRDKRSKEPAPELVRAFIDAAAEQGLLFGLVGTYGNVLRIAPPLVINEDEAQESLEIIGRVLDGLRPPP